MNKIYGMTLLRRITKELKTYVLQSFSCKCASINNSTPIVSFTFDDVPLSAFYNGVPILNSFGVKGTFYVCLGLEGARSKSHMGMREVNNLVSEGHEVGCHSFSHFKLKNGSVGDMIKDCIRNRSELEPVLGERGIINFSYPFGKVSFSLKRNLGSSYQSMRSTRHGVNKGKVDLNCLKAVPIYENENLTMNVSKWLDYAEKHSAWLIFYTHGVSERPGPYDTSTDSFLQVVGLCRAKGWPILPVHEVLSGFSVEGSK